MVEVACESDFVAKGDVFQALIKDLAMHIVAAKPLSVTPEEIPEEVKEKERAIFREQMKDKPANMLDKIVEGKMKSFYKERCLLQQEFVKDTTQTIEDLITAMIAKLGENITVKRFCRFEFGAE